MVGFGCPPRHTTELLVAAVRLVLDGVSQEGVGNKRLDAYNFILIVDRALDAKLSHRISEDVPLLSETAFAGRAAFIAFKPHQVLRRHGPLEETVRVERDLELACRRRRRLRIHVGSLQVPGIVAADEIDQPLFPLDRNSAAAAARVISLSANLLFSHGSGVEVNGPGET